MQNHRILTNVAEASSPTPGTPGEGRGAGSLEHHSSLKTEAILDWDYDEPIEYVAFHFSPTRRQFVQTLGAGLLIAVAAGPALAQRAGGREGRGGGRRGGGCFGQGDVPVAARLHIAQDGT